MNKKQAELQRVAQNLNSEEKYAGFDDSVMEAAQRQAQTVLDQAKQQADELYESLIASKRSDPVAAYRAEAQTKLARESAAQKQENRKKLLVYRRQLVNALFAEAEEEIETYVSSAQYESDMKKRLENLSKAVGKDAVTLYVKSGDEDRLGALARKIYPSCTVKSERSIRMGGFRLEAGRVRYDETLDFAAEAEREAFLTRCGLHVE